ncbi:MAG TPA: formate dehydrogenase accessory sulfurtransferase FdhD [Candidatus Bathyarchaeia archaeon]|nr:formate dehydrogenase accessory sulfurtransferase FdhD [Candidatus Bathyarchaeia archaeon]
MVEVGVTRIDVAAHAREHRVDNVAEEKPLHLFLNQIHYVTILCSPTLLRELAVGYLLSEGLLKSLDEIKDIKFEEGGKCRVQLRSGVEAEKRIAASQPFARLVLTACGSPDYWPLSKLIDRLDLRKIPLGFEVHAEVILEAVRSLNTLAETFRKTGGVHVAAVFSFSGVLIACAEDIGRHNAVDKVIGLCAFREHDFSQCFLASSGRLTGDIALKAARMRIPVVASLAAAIDSGIEVARRTGVTLVGFVRGQRMNVFTFPDRVVVSKTKRA